VVHIWFFKAMPSRLGNLLDMKTSDLEKIVYFQDYVVVDPGETPLKRCQILSEEEYRSSLDKFGQDAFRAMMGAKRAQPDLVQRRALLLLRKNLAAQVRSGRVPRHDGRRGRQGIARAPRHVRSEQPTARRAHQDQQQAEGQGPGQAIEDRRSLAAQ